MLLQLKIKQQVHESGDAYGTRLLANFPPFEKVKFKATPIERQSL